MKSIGVATRALRRVFLPAALAVGLTVPFAAHAEFEPGWYVGGGFGQYWVSEVEEGTGNIGGSATFQQIFGGFQLKFIAVEAGYAYLNDLSWTSGNIENTTQENGWFARGMLMLPFEYSPTTSVAVFGGATYYDLDTEFQQRDTLLGTLSKGNASTYAIGATGGLWIRGRRAATRIAYEYIEVDEVDFRGATTTDLDLAYSVWTINFIYHF